MDSAFCHASQVSFFLLRCFPGCLKYFTSILAGLLLIADDRGGSWALLSAHLEAWLAAALGFVRRKIKWRSVFVNRVSCSEKSRSPLHNLRSISLYRTDEIRRVGWTVLARVSSEQSLQERRKEAHFFRRHAPPPDTPHAGQPAQAGSCLARRPGGQLPRLRGTLEQLRVRRQGRLSRWRWPLRPG